MLTIYHWEPNANSGKPILAAFEKGVEFESWYIVPQCASASCRGCSMTQRRPNF